jgi:hypothetical protein
MMLSSIAVLLFLLYSTHGRGIGEKKNLTTDRESLQLSSTPINHAKVGQQADKVGEESLVGSTNYGHLQEVIDRWYNEVFLQLPFCPQPDRTKPEPTLTSCRPLPSHFTGYGETCNNEKEHANCNLRTSVPFHGYTVYGPDYGGIDSSNCTALRKPWTQASNNWHYNVRHWATVTDSWTTTEYDYSTSTFTSGGTSYGYLVTKSSLVFVTSKIDDWSYPKYPISAPCAIQMGNPGVCSSSQNWARQLAPTGVRGRSSWRDPERELLPGCTAGCDRCAIRASTAQVLYWPTPVTRNVLPTDIATVIAVHNNKTYTSPTVYISFDALSATNNCGPVGQKYQDIVVTLPQREILSTLEGYSWHWTAKTARSFDFRDLNQPIQADIYRKLIGCGAPATGCEGRGEDSNKTISCACPVAVLNGYTPKIVWPEAVRTVDTEWANCYLDIYGLSESPIALKPTPVAQTQKLYVTASPRSYAALVAATPFATSRGIM